MEFPEDYSDLDTIVCENCIGEEFLIEHCRNNPTAGSCDYCENSQHVAITEANGIVELIYKFLIAYYSDIASSGMPYDSGDAAFPHSISDTSEILNDCIDEPNEGFIDHVCNAMCNDAWVYCGEGGSWAEVSESERKYNAWKAFSGQTKHKTRYFFYVSDEHDYIYEPDSYMPRELLNKVCEDLQGLSLIESIESKTLLYRARVCDKNQRFVTLEELGLPPDEYASAGRMNPLGISYGYFAFDTATAILEVAPSPPFSASVGEFSLVQNINVLNLSKLANSIPSIFDIERRQTRESLIFLNFFVKEISKPFVSGGSQQKEYIPTQIFSEYLNIAFRASDNSPIDGIMYQSAAHESGANLVLFPARDFIGGWHKIVNLNTTDTLQFENWNQLKYLIA